MPPFSSASHLPLSPLSPPETGVKSQTDYSYSGVAPNTPPSPPHMSVATKSYVSSYENGGHTNEMSPRHSDDPETYNRAVTNNTTADQPHSLKRSHPPDTVQQQQQHHETKRQKREEGEDIMEIDSTQTATNHDREEPERALPNLRNDVKAERFSQADTAVSSQNEKLERKEKGVEEGAFLICRSTHRRAPVNMSRHILGTYGLHSLLASVARVDPDTMEKAAGIRKSYQGQIDLAKLPGKNKPASTELEEGEEYRFMTRLARMDDQQYARHGFATEMNNVTSVRAMIPQAMELHAGTMPPETTKEWDVLLGHEDQKKKQKQSLPQPGGTAQTLPPSRTPNGVRPTQRPPVNNSAQVDDRIRTRGKKRSYDDSSYVGYRGYVEGYSDTEDH